MRGAKSSAAVFRAALESDGMPNSRKCGADVVCANVGMPYCEYGRYLFEGKNFVLVCRLTFLEELAVVAELVYEETSCFV